MILKVLHTEQCDTSTCTADTSQAQVCFLVLNVIVNYALWYKNHKMGCCDV